MGCSDPAPPPPPPKPAVIIRKPVVVVGDAKTTDSESGVTAPVPVELQFVGVGDLHQRWFGDDAIVAKLARDLGRCMTGVAVLRTTWDEPTKTGKIWLLLDGHQLTCRPVKGSSVDITPLQPLMKALAGYRDQVSGQFDLRVASFRAGIEVLKGTKLCRLQLGGQFPPDGTTLDACIDMGGELRCLPDRTQGHVLYSYPDPAQSAYLAACLAR